MAWNRPDENATKRKTAPRFGRGALAGVIVAALAAGALYWLMGGDPKLAKKAAETAKKPAQIVEVQPSISTNVVEEVVEDTSKKERAAKLKAMTPKERADVKWQEMVEKPLDLTVPSNRVVATATEQIMAWIFTADVGSVPPPLPQIPDHEFAHITEILMSDNPIKAGDDDRVVETKQTIEFAKKELREYIKKGGDPDEFLAYYRGQLVQAHAQYEDARKSVLQTLREDPDIALEYLDRVNSELEAKGIKKVTLHPNLLKHHGISEQ